MLECVICPLSTPPLLVFDGVELPIPLFDDIGFATYSEVLCVQIDAAELQSPVARAALTSIYPLMQNRTLDRTFILDKDVLDKDVVAPPRAVIVLIKSGQEDEFFHIS